MNLLHTKEAFEYFKAELDQGAEDQLLHGVNDEVKRAREKFVDLIDASSARDVTNEVRENMNTRYGLTVGELIDKLEAKIADGTITRDAYFGMPNQDHSESMVKVRGLASVQYAAVGIVGGDRGAVYLNPIIWKD